MPIRILIGACVRQDPGVLRAYLSTLYALKAPAGATLDYLFIDDNEAPEASEALYATGATVWKATARPEESDYAIGPHTHLWSIGAFEHVARQKQRILNHALAYGYDAVMLADSDLVLSPRTLLSLWHANAPVVNGVFWTQWDKSSPYVPQVWMRHPSAMDGLGMLEHEVIEALRARQCIRVAGSGACVLIRREVLEADVGYHPRLDGLPTSGMWQGEDRAFAIRLESAGIHQYADGWPHIIHAYHPEQRTPEYLASALDAVASEDAPTYIESGSTWINARIDPLDFPELAEALPPPLRLVRGQWGQLHLEPALRDALEDMSVGDERIINGAFGQRFGYFTVRLIDVA